MEKEEIDKKTVIRTNWKKLIKQVHLLPIAIVRRMLLFSLKCISIRWSVRGSAASVGAVFLGLATAKGLSVSSRSAYRDKLARNGLQPRGRVDRGCRLCSFTCRSHIRLSAAHPSLTHTRASQSYAPINTRDAHAAFTNSRTPSHHDAFINVPKHARKNNEQTQHDTISGRESSRRAEQDANKLQASTHPRHPRLFQGRHQIPGRLCSRRAHGSGLDTGDTREGKGDANVPPMVIARGKHVKALPERILLFHTVVALSLNAL